MDDSHTHGASVEMVEGGGGGGGRGPVVGKMRGGCLLAVGARRARGSNKFSSVQFRHAGVAERVATHPGVRPAFAGARFSEVLTFET